ncbi:uncharacterized protein LOC110855792 isoform X6 [Folsomia candida]|uniref:uncharacterized protein LOC110855792 isoform X6 n=1 Tax=Folsomia candida TaxID=158441 RepID=UPI00160544CC|nr:uncharacterized protein LOC110855792 isoform X6 [Folsomia candida]
MWNPTTKIMLHRACLETNFLKMETKKCIEQSAPLPETECVNRDLVAGHSGSVTRDDDLLAVANPETAMEDLLSPQELIDSYVTPRDKVWTAKERRKHMKRCKNFAAKEARLKLAYANKHRQEQIEIAEKETALKRKELILSKFRGKKEEKKNNYGQPISFDAQMRLATQNVFPKDDNGQRSSNKKTGNTKVPARPVGKDKPSVSSSYSKANKKS